MSVVLLTCATLARDVCHCPARNKFVFIAILNVRDLVGAGLGGCLRIHACRDLAAPALPAHRRCARILAGGETAGKRPPTLCPGRGRGTAAQIMPFRRNHCGFKRARANLVRRPSRAQRSFGDFVPVVSPPANILAHVPCAGMPSCLVPDNNSDFCNSLLVPAHRRRLAPVTIIGWC
jgi:hypothetical protein